MYSEYVLQMHFLNYVCLESGLRCVFVFVFCIYMCGASFYECSFAWFGDSPIRFFGNLEPTSNYAVLEELFTIFCGERLGPSELSVI